jgi:beta-glucosidase
MRKIGPASVLALLLTGAAFAAPVGQARVHWPAVHSAVPHDPKIESRIDSILKRMSVEEKVGQIVQADINFITPRTSANISLARSLPAGTARRTTTIRRPQPIG